MKPSQKEVNEFLLDFVEFLGKHFTSSFDKTKMAGGNESISVILKYGKAGSELELDTDRAKVNLRIGEVKRGFDAQAGKNALFSAVIADLLSIFEDRLFPVSGYCGGKFVTGAFYRDLDADAAIDDFKSLHPECDGIVAKQWTRMESGMPGEA